MISKTLLKTVAVTLAVLWAVHNIGILSPAKDFLNFDQ